MPTVNAIERADGEPGSVEIVLRLAIRFSRHCFLRKKDLFGLVLAGFRVEFHQRNQFSLLRDRPNGLTGRTFTGDAMSVANRVHFFVGERDGRPIAQSLGSRDQELVPTVVVK